KPGGAATGQGPHGTDELGHLGSRPGSGQNGEHRCGGLELGAEVFEGYLTGGFVDEDDVGSGAGGFVARFGPDDDRRMVLRHLHRGRGPGRRVLGTGRVLRLRFLAVEAVAVGAAARGRVAVDRVGVYGATVGAYVLDDMHGVRPKSAW